LFIPRTGSAKALGGPSRSTQLVCRSAFVAPDGPETTIIDPLLRFLDIGQSDTTVHEALAVIA
jgi:hypothetical protein